MSEDQMDYGAFLKEEGLPNLVPTTMEEVKRSMKVYADEIYALELIANEFQVVDDQTKILAVEMSAQAKRLYKTLKRAVDEIIKKPNGFVKSVRKLFATYETPLKRIPANLEQKLLDYKTQVELERRKREEAAKKEREKLQKRLNAEAKAAGVEAPILPEPVIPKKESITRTEEGTAYERRDWTFDIENLWLVPRDYLMLDKQKVRQAIKMGVRSIEGLHIYEKSKIITRT